MPKLYEARIKVTKESTIHLHELERKLATRGLRGANCKFEERCIECTGYLPLDKLQEMKYIEGVMDVALDNSEDNVNGESD